VFPAMVTDSPIYDDERTLVGIVGISFDITERKRAEEELRQSERQLAEAQNLARVGGWNWDMLNDILTWTDQIYRIYGLTPQEFTPTRQHFLASLHPDDREYVLGVIDNSLRTQEPFSYHYRIVRPDGEVRIVHSNRNVASDEHGNLLRSFGTMQDVTERRQAEEQLTISNEKLRALSARLQTVREEESDQDRARDSRRVRRRVDRAENGPFVFGQTAARIRQRGRASTTQGDGEIY